MCVRDPGYVATVRQAHGALSLPGLSLPKGRRAEVDDAFFTFAEGDLFASAGTTGVCGVWVRSRPTKVLNRGYDAVGSLRNGGINVDCDSSGDLGVYQSA